MRLIFPPRCPMCGALSEKGRICDSCKPEVCKIEPPVCKRCGSGKKYCKCAENRHLFEACTSAYYYKGAVRRGVQRYKFRDKPSSSRFFIDACAKKVSEEYAGYIIDVVTAVPMHKDDKKERGFNSADLLAKGIAKKLKLNCDCEILQKPYKNKKQRTLSMNERAGNVLGVYEVAKPEAVTGKTVLLCDDVFTTGATFDECAKMLLFAGADTVLCVCAAITPPPQRENH